VTEGTEYVEPSGEQPAEEPLERDAEAGAMAPGAAQAPSDPVDELEAGVPEQSTLFDAPVAVEEEAAPEAAPQSEGTAPEPAEPEDPDAVAVSLEEPTVGAEPPAEEVVDEATAQSSEAEADDVAAAIAAAGANVEAEPTLDDIAPGTVVAEEHAAVTEVNVGRDTVSIWPFVVYDVIWAAFAGYLVWQLEMLPNSTAVFDAEIYPYAVLGGVALTIAGPLLILAVWIASWGKPGSTKGGLLVSSLIRGSVATLLGVVMWWGALMVLDQMRLGRLL